MKQINDAHYSANDFCDQDIQSQSESAQLMMHRGSHDIPINEIRQEESSRMHENCKVMRSACECCRRRRVKCDGRQPCQHCQKRNLECVYSKRSVMGRPRKQSSNSQKSKTSTSLPLLAEVLPGVDGTQYAGSHSSKDKSLQSLPQYPLARTHSESAGNCSYWQPQPLEHAESIHSQHHNNNSGNPAHGPVSVATSAAITTSSKQRRQTISKSWKPAAAVHTQAKVMSSSASLDECRIFSALWDWLFVMRPNHQAEWTKCGCTSCLSAMQASEKLNCSSDSLMRCAQNIIRALKQPHSGSSLHVNGGGGKASKGQATGDFWWWNKMWHLMHNSGDKQAEQFFTWAVACALPEQLPRGTFVAMAASIRSCHHHQSLQSFLSRHRTMKVQDAAESQFCCLVVCLEALFPIAASAIQYDGDHATSLSAHLRTRQAAGFRQLLNMHSACIHFKSREPSHSSSPDCACSPHGGNLMLLPELNEKGIVDDETLHADIQGMSAVLLAKSEAYLSETEQNHLKGAFQLSASSHRKEFIVLSYLASIFFGIAKCNFAIQILEQDRQGSSDNAPRNQTRDYGDSAPIWQLPLVAEYFPDCLTQFMSNVQRMDDDDRAQGNLGVDDVTSPLYRRLLSQALQSLKQADISVLSDENIWSMRIHVAFLTAEMCIAELNSRGSTSTVAHAQLLEAQDKCFRKLHELCQQEQTVLSGQGIEWAAALDGPLGMASVRAYVSMAQSCRPVTLLNAGHSDENDSKDPSIEDGNDNSRHRSNKYRTPNQHFASTTVRVESMRAGEGQMHGSQYSKCNLQTNSETSEDAMRQQTCLMHSPYIPSTDLTGISLPVLRDNSALFCNGQYNSGGQIDMQDTRFSETGDHGFAPDFIHGGHQPLDALCSFHDLKEKNTSGINTSMQETFAESTQIREHYDSECFDDFQRPLLAVDLESF